MLTRNPLLETLACPVCKSNLERFSDCNECGSLFPQTGGPPSLIPASANRHVSFTFASERSVARQTFRDVFRYPPHPTAKDLPYHLDLAHAELLHNLPSGSRVLEIGCGGGQMRDYLSARGVKYVGTDLSVVRVTEDLRVHGGADLLADAHFLPFRDGQFDFVYSAAVVEHLACPFLAVQEVRRVLKPGGRFVGSVSFMEPWHDDSFYHMSPLGVFELMDQAELTPEYVWPGRGYSGFNALMAMGNKATIKARVLGRLTDYIYRTGNKLRNTLKRLPADIADDAKIGGAINWIALRA